MCSISQYRRVKRKKEKQSNVMSTLENLPSFEGIGTGVSDNTAGSAEACLLSARLGPCVTAPCGPVCVLSIGT